MDCHYIDLQNTQKIHILRDAEVALHILLQDDISKRLHEVVVSMRKGRQVRSPKSGCLPVAESRTWEGKKEGCSGLLDSVQCCTERMARAELYVTRRRALMPSFASAERSKGRKAAKKLTSVWPEQGAGWWRVKRT